MPTVSNLKSFLCVCVGSTRLYLLEWRWRHPGAGQQANARINAQVPLYLFLFTLTSELQQRRALMMIVSAFALTNIYLDLYSLPSLSPWQIIVGTNRLLTTQSVTMVTTSRKIFSSGFLFCSPPPAYIVSRRFLVTWEPPEGNRWTHHFLREQFRLSLTLWVVGRGRSVPWVCSAAETFHVDTPVSPRLMLRGFIPLVADITKFSVKIPPWPCQRTFFMKLGRGTQQWDLSWIAEDFDPHSTLTWLHSRNYTFV